METTVCRSMMVLLLVVGHVGLVAARQGNAPASIAAPADVAGRVGDVVITVRDVDEAWRAADPGGYRHTAQAVYDGRRGALERLIGDRLIAHAAKARGIDPELFARDETAKRLKPVTAEAVRAFYDENRGRMGGKPFEEMQPAIRGYLEQQHRSAARAALVAELRKSGPAVRVVLDPLRQTVPVGPDDPVRGAPDAPVVLVEFSDYQCRYCAGVVPTLARLLEAYPGRVRLVFRDFPLESVHTSAFKAGEAAHCAGEQGKYWELHDRMFADTKALGVDALKKSAAELGLDTATFGACIDSGKYASKVRASVEAGKALGVASTPSVFVNGRLVVGAQPYEVFRDLVEEELERHARP